VVEEAYQAWLWVDERASAFPKLARGTLGRRLSSALLDALARTVEATYSPRGRLRADLLASANRSLSVGRILLRAARDRRHLSVAQHEHGMELLDAWGRQLGGWLRAERAREPRP
jgi:hypothetical protein